MFFKNLKREDLSFKIIVEPLILLVIPFVCAVSPILIVYSWLIHTRGILYWLLCIATYLAFRFVPKWLGIDMTKFLGIWTQVWLMLCALIYLIIA